MSTHLDMLRKLNADLADIHTKVLDLQVAKGALEVENDELRRTVDDLRRQLKKPPY